MLATLSTAAEPTAAEADVSDSGVECDDSVVGTFCGRIAWINAICITDDTAALAARIGAERTERAVRDAKDAARFDRTPGLSSARIASSRA